MMPRFVFLLALPALMLAPAAAQEPSSSDQAAKRKRERLIEIYRNDAASYALFRDASRKDRLELQRDPVYVWTNLVRSGGQDGAVFVWTWKGRAEAVGSMYSDPAVGPRKLNHEFQSLSLATLDVEREGGSGWTPEGPGIDLAPMPDAPRPAASANARLIQMRALSREFSAHTVDHKDQQWNLRVLPQPLFRAASTDPDVLDSAVFTFVTSAGTDPEVLIVIEARRPAGGGEPVWHYGIGRFTDLDLWVEHKGTEVYRVPKVVWNSERQDPKHRYRAFRVRNIPAVEDDAPAATEPEKLP